MINAADINAADINGTASSGGGLTIAPSWPLSLEVVPYAPSWPLTLEVVPYTLTPSWPLRLSVTQTLTPSWPLRLQVVGLDALLNTQAHGWGYRASLDGVDITARLIGPMSTRAEENMASTATWSMLPSSGALALDAYIGQDVALDYTWRSADGASTVTVPLWRGVVESVAIDPATLRITFTGVDRRAELLAAGGAAALPGSLWSVAVFQEDADALQQQEDRLRTLCAAYDLLPDGSPRLTPWEANASPDWTIHAADYIWGSLAVDIANRQARIQRVECAFRYRFSRLRLRETSWAYSFGSFSTLAAQGIAPPGVALIEEAIANSGLMVLQDSQYNRLAQQWYDIGGVWYSFPGYEAMVLEAQLYLGRRWAQSVEEEYTLTVDCAAAGIDARLTRQIQGALECSFDARAWEDNPDAAPVLARPYLATETLFDATTDPDTGRAAAARAQETLLAMAQHDIRDSHRATRFSFGCRLNPYITRASTVLFDAAGWQVQGKVYAIEHTLDPEAGAGTLAARTTVTLAVSRPSLTNPTPTALDAAPAPAAPTLDIDTEQAHKITATTLVGATATSPAWDEATMQGYVVNIPGASTVSGMLTSWGVGAMHATPTAGSYDSQPYVGQSAAEGASYYDGEIANPDYVEANAYPMQFRIIAPDAEAAARDNLTETVAATYLVDVPEDLFACTVS